MAIRRLPARTFDEVVAAFPAYRQSLLGHVDNCALSARFDLEGSAYDNAAQARGIIFHRFAAELLRTLHETGELQIPHEEAMRILYEVSRQADVKQDRVVIVPARERLTLRKCCLALADVPMNVTRLMAVEERLEATLSYSTPDGPVERVISGQPDALLSDPPGGAVVLDWKTIRSAPAKGEQSHWTGDEAHVSYEGYWQQRFYALLVMRTYPSVERVTLREYYVLPREARVATVPRAALEHIEQELALVVEFLDQALQGGSESPLWRPSPGVHCSYCRRPQSCPIEREARAAEGGISSERQAAQVAAEAVLAAQVKTQSMAALKGWHDATSRPIPVKDAKGRAEFRWGQDAGGRRRFKLHIPDESDRGNDDPQLAEAFAAAAVRKAVAV